MLKTSFALAAAVLGTAILGSQTAQGSTIDTFNLVETGWDAYSIITGVGPANPNGLLTASFSGSVEADGFIALADLWWTPFSGQKKGPFLDRAAALKMKESQCLKPARVTHPA